MGFLDDALKKLDEAHEWVDTQGGARGIRDEANKRADEVFEAAKQMGGKIPGDVDDQLITKAQALKDKLSGIK